MSSYLVDSSALPFEGTSHSSGQKKILFPGNGSSLTQFAYGFLKKGEIIPVHRHESMDEYFYFLEGDGVYEIEGEVVQLREGAAVYIPAKHMHQLIARTELGFVYFGIAVNI